MLSEQSRPSRRITRGDIAIVLVLVVAFGVLGNLVSDANRWVQLAVVLSAGLVASAVVTLRQRRR